MNTDSAGPGLQLPDADLACRGGKDDVLPPTAQQIGADAGDDRGRVDQDRGARRIGHHGRVLDRAGRIDLDDFDRAVAGMDEQILAAGAQQVRARTRDARPGVDDQGRGAGAGHALDIGAADHVARGIHLPERQIPIGGAHEQIGSTQSRDVGPGSDDGER